MKRLFGLVLAVCALLVAVPALATRISPMVIELTTSGRGASARVEVTNSNNTPFPFEARMYKGTVSETGELALEPADEQFLIFPPQGVIAAERTQIVRIQYIGTEPLQKSEIFYLAIGELPVPLDKSAPMQIQVLSRFNILVNVVPPNVKAQPAVDWIRPATREGQQGVEVRVVNSGDKYFAAGRTGWALDARTTAGQPFELRRTAAEIAQTIGFGVVPPGGSRIFFVPTEQPIAEGSASVTFR